MEKLLLDLMEDLRDDGWELLLLLWGVFDTTPDFDLPTLTAVEGLSESISYPYS